MASAINIVILCTVLFSSSGGNEIPLDYGECAST